MRRRRWEGRFGEGRGRPTRRRGRVGGRREGGRRRRLDREGRSRGGWRDPRGWWLRGRGSLAFLSAIHWTRSNGHSVSRRLPTVI